MNRTMTPKKLRAMKAAEFKRLLDRYTAIEGNTINAMAEAMGLSRVTIWRWANDERKIDRFTAEALRAFFQEKLGD